MSLGGIYQPPRGRPSVHGRGPEKRTVLAFGARFSTCTPGRHMGRPMPMANSGLTQMGAGRPPAAIPIPWAVWYIQQAATPTRTRGSGRQGLARARPLLASSPIAITTAQACVAAWPGTSVAHHTRRQQGKGAVIWAI